VRPPVQGKRVPEAFDSEEPGAFSFDHPGYISCTCPCGCGSLMNLPIYLEGEAKPAKSAWRWNGSEDKPTLDPSIRDLSGCRFHGYLKDSVWTFCEDSGK